MWVGGWAGGRPALGLGRCSLLHSGTRASLAFHPTHALPSAHCCRWWSSTQTWRTLTWRPCTPPCSPSAARVGAGAGRRAWGRVRAALHGAFSRQPLGHRAQLPASTSPLALPLTSPCSRLSACRAVYPGQLGYVDRVLQTCHDVRLSVVCRGSGWGVLQTRRCPCGGLLAETRRHHGQPTTRCPLPCPIPTPHYCRPQALQRRGPVADAKAERQVAALLATPLERYDAVTGAPGARWGRTCGVWRTFAVAGLAPTACVLSGSSPEHERHGSHCTLSVDWPCRSAGPGPLPRCHGAAAAAGAAGGGHQAGAGAAGRRHAGAAAGPSGDAVQVGFYYYYTKRKRIGSLAACCIFLIPVCPRRPPAGRPRVERPLNTCLPACLPATQLHRAAGAGRGRAAGGAG